MSHSSRGYQLPARWRRVSRTSGIFRVNAKDAFGDGGSGRLVDGTVEKPIARLARRTALWRFRAGSVG